MPYRRGVYDYTVDSSFRPFSMQEMLVPFTAYKDAYEKAEEAYDTLQDKADTFKYLSDSLPEGSKARQIYEGYAHELQDQAKDFASHGLTLTNKRALSSLRKRYQGEIGRLSRADEALQKERELRRQMGAKDSSLLYAMDNLNIDDFLDGSNPNLYSISGTELYGRGAAAGKAASSRVYRAGDEGSTLNGYYRKWVETYGYSKESMDAFRANAAAIPELQQAADSILAERGVPENLTGANLERARQSVLNGIIDGAVYQEKGNPVRDAGVLSASERDTSARGWAGQNLTAAMHGMIKDSSSPTGYRYDPSRDPSNNTDNEWMYSHDETGRRTGFSPEYEDAVKKGLVPGKNLSSSSSSKSGKGRSSSTSNLLPSFYVDSKGNWQSISHPTGASVHYGAPITYEEAVEMQPSLASVDRNNYTFTYNESEKRVYVQKGTTGNSGVSSGTSTEEEEEDGNQL